MLRSLTAKAAGFAIVSLAMFTSSVSRVDAAIPVSNGARAVDQAIDQGPVDPEQEITLTVHLKSPNKAAFDRAVAELTNPASASYEHWMTAADLKKYAPSATAIAAVTAELAKHGLSVISVDPQGFSVRVRGTVANAQKAFQTELHQYTLNKRTFRAHAQAARLTGGADAYVLSVSGLESHQARPLLSRATNPVTGKVPAAVLASKVQASATGLSSIVTDTCFSAPREFTFKTPGKALPKAVYFGNVYDDTPQICSFTPAQLQAHYGLPAAYAQGLDGTGQTIALVEAYGYPTIQADANTFSALTGLPPLTSSNFEIVYPSGPPKDPNAGILVGWNAEIALDVQWAHSIAPNAKILVVAASGQDSEDFQTAINYVVNNHLANSVSNSWEIDLDDIAGSDELASFDAVLENAVAQGVSVHFSTGDSGDNGLGRVQGAPGVPSDSPYATAVGGTSILNFADGTSVETGWGTGRTVIDAAGPLDPPVQLGLFGGAGGGESIQYYKPWWQGAVPGGQRLVPDVSALSDPYTGVFIVLTQGTTQYLEAGYGGTSLACPIFSAFWAITNQAAGHTLGLAALFVSNATANQLIDIVPFSSPTNPSGVIYDKAGSNYYSPSDLLSQTLVLGPPIPFFSAIWPVPATSAHVEEHLVLGFGMDTSLTVTPGWDNVTGFGVPNGLAFINGFK